jgi:hypothetical protein
VSPTGLQIPAGDTLRPTWLDAARSRFGLSSPERPSIVCAMFSVDEATAAAVRQVYEASGELSAVVEFRRHFPGVTNNETARLCVRTIAGWKPLKLPPRPPDSTGGQRRRPTRPERGRIPTQGEWRVGRRALGLVGIAWGNRVRMSKQR